MRFNALVVNHQLSCVWECNCNKTARSKRIQSAFTKFHCPWLTDWLTPLTTFTLAPFSPFTAFPQVLCVCLLPSASLPQRLLCRAVKTWFNLTGTIKKFEITLLHRRRIRLIRNTKSDIICSLLIFMLHLFVLKVESVPGDYFSALLSFYTRTRTLGVQTRWPFAKCEKKKRMCVCHSFLTLTLLLALDLFSSISIVNWVVKCEDILWLLMDWWFNFSKGVSLLVIV